MTGTGTLEPPRRSRCPAAVRDLVERAWLTMPEPSRHVVRRQRLLDVLEHSTAPLILLSAPAGMGKTTLAVDWATSCALGHRLVWVNCQDDEVDPVAELFSALDAPSDGRVRLPSAPDADRRRLLVEAIERSSHPILAVFDGYELTSLAAAHELDGLLHYASGRLRVLLTARADPVLPLHRYRLTESMLEIRAADLAFSDDEAKQLLRRCGTPIGDAGVLSLNARLAGWAAGLRFAARALSGRDAAEELLSTAVTSNGDINAFFVGEVLDVQPPRTRALMLAASVPDVIRRDLLEELTGVPAGPCLLELERANVFLEPMPGDPSVMHFVPLFRDLLRAQLAYEDPARMVELNRRAADWYTRHAMWDEALHHRVRSGDAPGVCELMIRHRLIGRLLCEPPTGTMRAAAEAVRSGTTGADGRVVAAALAQVEGDLDRCAAELSVARDSPGLSPTARVVAAVVDAVRAEECADAATAADLAARAESMLAGQALTLGTPHPSGDLGALARRASATAALRLGSFHRAGVLLRHALESPTACWSASFRAQCLATLAVLDAYAGHVCQAVGEATEALRAVEAVDSGGLAGSTTAGDRDGHRARLAWAAHLARAYAALEAHDLAAADEHLARAGGQPRPMWRALREIVAAGLDRSRGQLQRAVDRIDAVVDDVARSDPWTADWLRVERSALNVALREPREALADLDRVSRDHAHAATARAIALDALGDRGSAVQCLARSAHGGQATTRAQVAHELAMAAVTAHESPQRARSAVREALRLARPAGLRRPFVEVGPAVAAILDGNGPGPGSDWLHPQEHGPAQTRDSARGTVITEPLTSRELEVLVCLNALLSTEEIAQKLFVSVNTVRTHVRNILAKLGVTRRTAAVREARRLGLLPDP